MTQTDKTLEHDDPRVVAALEAYLADWEAGRSPDPAAVLAAHPDVAGALADCLDGLNLLHGGGPPRPVGPGDKLGPYTLTKEIGRGGMGVVFEAEDTDLGRTVAVKVLPNAGPAEPTELERFRNEARAAAALAHSNIVPVFGVGCDRGVHYFAMQRIDGRSLARVIADRPPPAERVRLAKVVLLQAAEALAHAHARGIVHRDVTPGNLLLDAAGRVWVADFGLARVPGADRLTRTGAVVGTLRYMSPEQVDPRRGAVDGRTDLYGLGAVVYELLTGEPPFPAADRTELLARILTAPPPSVRRRNPAVSADLETVVWTLLAKAPDDRYQSADDLAADAHRLRANDPVRAKRRTVFARGVRWADRNPRKVTAAVVVLVIGLTAATAAGSWLSAQRTYAREALDELARTAELELAREPGTEEARRDMLLRVRNRYDRLAVGWVWTAEDRLAAARAGRLVADIDARLGRTADAERGYDEAVTRLSPLTGTDHGRRELAAALNNRGNLHRKAGRLDAADRDYQAAAAGYAGNEFADMAGWAGAENNRGLVDQLRDRPSDAAARFRAARTAFERLADGNPGRGEWLADAAGAAFNLGAIAAEAGRKADALTEFEHAADLASRALTLSPGQPGYRRTAARAKSAAAGALVRLDRAAAAEPVARAAVDELGRLAADAPRAVPVRLDLATAHRTWADALAGLDRPLDACREYDEADIGFSKLAGEGVPLAAAEAASTRLAAARAYRAAGNRSAADKLIRDAADVMQSAGTTRYEQQIREACRVEVARLRP